MRADTSRRLNTQPMKSPSPDIANRSIIQDTKLPLDDIHRYLEKSGQSKSPKVSKYQSVKNTGNQQQIIQNLQNRIKTLQKCNAQLQAENKFLKSQKAKMIYTPKQNSIGPIDQLVESEYTSRNISPKNIQEDDKMKQIQDRLMNFVNQNGRLAKMLYEKDNVIKGLQQQLNNIQYNNQKSRKLPIKIDTTNINPQTTQIKNFYDYNIMPLMQKNQIIWINRINQLNNRIQNLQNKLHSLQKVPARAITPEKYSTNQKTICTPISINKNTVIDSIRPFSQSQSISKEQQLQKQVQNLRNKCYSLQFQLGKLKQRKTVAGQSTYYQQPITDYHNNNKSPLSRSIISNKSRTNTQNQNFLKDKIQQLEFKLEQKLITISDLKSQIQAHKNSMKLLQQKHDRQKQLLQTDKNRIKTDLNTERDKNQQLTDRILKFEQDYDNSQQQRSSILKNNQQLQAFYQQKLKECKKQCQEKLQNKQKQLEIQLGKYLKLLNQIRKDIEGSDGQYDINSSQVMGSSQKLSKIHQDNINIIQNLKKQLLVKQQQLLQLQTQNKLLLEEIHQLKIQQQKLKTMIQDNQQFTKKIAANMDLHKSQQNCKLKLCLKQTMKKIQLLQSQISQALRD